MVYDEKFSDFKVSWQYKKADGKITVFILRMVTGDQRI